MESIIKLANNTQWVNEAKVKVGKCTKCKSYQSVGWLFEWMAWYRDYCHNCQTTTKFIVQPFLKYVPPKGSENGYVKDGVGYAVNINKQ